MQRIYYVTDSVEVTEAISERLHGFGISDWNFHVVAKDEAGMIAHRIHRATLYQQLDIVHSGERYALLYAAVGLVTGLLVALRGWAPVEPDWVFVVGFAFFTGFFGAWTGGLIGVSRENYKLAPFHADIEAGRYLLMIDVKQEQRSEVREMINMNFPTAEQRGKDSTTINPFAVPQQIHDRIT
jgi:hypothetical protein